MEIAKVFKLGHIDVLTKSLYSRKSKFICLGEKALEN